MFDRHFPENASDWPWKEEHDMKIGERLWEARVAAGLTQESAAEKMNIAISDHRDWCKSQRVKTSRIVGIIFHIWREQQRIDSLPDRAAKLSDSIHVWSGAKYNFKAKTRDWSIAGFLKFWNSRGYYSAHDVLKFNCCRLRRLVILRLLVLIAKVTVYL